MHGLKYAWYIIGNVTVEVRDELLWFLPYHIVYSNFS
jgi:hypothetical protein